MVVPNTELNTIFDMIDILDTGTRTIIIECKGFLA